MAGRYCSNCGQQLGGDSRFCPGCGRSLSETAYVSTPEAETSAPTPPTAAQQGTGQRHTWRNIALGCVVVPILLLLIGSLLLGGGGGDNSTSAPQGDSGQEGSGGQEDSGSPGSSEDDPAPIGEIAQNGNLSWEITDVEQTNEIGDSFDSMSGNFVLVDFQVENTGNEAATIDYDYLLLLDNQDRENEPSIDASMYVPTDRDPFYTDISPGVTNEYRTVYEVAPDAEGFVLEATSENFDEGYSYLSLGI